MPVVAFSLSANEQNINENKINDTEFMNPNVDIISNITANPTSNSNEIKLLIDQIEKPVRGEKVNNRSNLKSITLLKSALARYCLDW